MSENGVEQRHVVGAIFYNQQGEVLLQQRDEKPGLRYPGMWTFFGGAVEADETFDEAIRRELEEELELRDVPLTLWYEYVCPARTVAGEVVTTNHVYIAPFDADLSTLTLLEGQAMGWFGQAEGLALDLAFMQTPILARFFAEHPQEMAR